MASKDFLLLVVIALSFAYFKKFLIINPILILSLFLIWLGLTYLKVHNRNKRIRTPRPVYQV
jgi:NhaP-type Na+/H+ or K+/H+ antiporter